MADCSIQRAYGQKMQAVGAGDGATKLFFGENITDLAHISSSRLSPWQRSAVARLSHQLSSPRFEFLR
jgi:hypothetical protein